MFWSLLHVFFLNNGKNNKDNDIRSKQIYSKTYVSLVVNIFAVIGRKRITSSYKFESISGRETINAARHFAAALRTFQLTSSSSVYSLALSLPSTKQEPIN